MTTDEYFKDNLANWNDRVPIHTGPDGYQVERFTEDEEFLSGVVDFDRQHLGPVAGKTLLHPQCHIGMDTLSWAKLGAHVTGFDFSDPALEVGRGMADVLGLNARFVESELYDSPNVIDETFDIVYTGVGALCWLPDITRWAEVMATFTRPDGTLYIREGHPVLWTLDYDRDDTELRIIEPYFETAEPSTWTVDETYAGSGKLDHPTTHQWNHGLGEIADALIRAGFRLDSFQEHRFLEWQAMAHMQEVEGRYYLPEGQRDLVPLMYTIMATRM